MDLITQVNGGRIVYSKGQGGFEEVIQAFGNARWINIVTYDVMFINNHGLERLHKINPCCKVRIVSNIPHKPGEKVTKKIRDLYLAGLKPEKFNHNTSVYFNFNNHSKIVMTNELAYIGSANFSSSSFHELGFIFDDPEAIKNLDYFVRRLCETSNAYYSNVIQNSLKTLVDLRQIDKRVIRSLLALSKKADAARGKKSEYYYARSGIRGLIDVSDIKSEIIPEEELIKDYLYSLDMNQIKMIHYAMYLGRGFFVQDFEGSDSESIPVLFEGYEGISGWTDKHKEIDHILNKSVALSRYLHSALLILDMDGS